MSIPIQCRVCKKAGKWRPAKRQMLCDKCDAKLPDKVCREAFDIACGVAQATTPSSVRRDRYSDYLTSPLSLDAYLKEKQ